MPSLTHIELVGVINVCFLKSPLLSLPYVLPSLFVQSVYVYARAPFLLIALFQCPHRTA
jgi:hypothetical protein